MVIMANRKHGNTPLKVGLYDIGEVIGEGNFATVRFARHRHTKSDVAIKIIDKTKLTQSDLDKVNREIEIMRLLSHPNIIKLYQVMKTETMLYLVTEYAPNGEIFDHIVKNGKLSESESRKKFWQILSAIEYCHNCRVVHRDLKAENLLLDANGNIKIADFGFGNQFSDGDRLATFCGSPPYAAPELFEGKTYKGPEVDIWSLGVVLYVLVCGGLPFYGENLRDLKDRVVKGMFRIPYWMSEDCEHLIRRMLVRDPDKRYTIDQIKKHRWLLADGPLKPINSFPVSVSGCGVEKNGVGPEDYNELVLRLMDQLGMERQKTIEQLNKNNDHYTAIYHLLLDRTRLHRSSYPLEKQSDPRQQRRPSTVADNALSQMSKYLQQSAYQQANSNLPAHNGQQAHSEIEGSYPSLPIGIHSQYPAPTTHTIDYPGSMTAAHMPLTSVPSYTPSIDTTYSTSAESGLEVDMETSELTSPTICDVPNTKPPLTRRHTLTGMTGIPSAEYMLRSMGGPSIDSGHSMELPSQSHSIESNLDSDSAADMYSPQNSASHGYSRYNVPFSNYYQALPDTNNAAGSVNGIGIKQYADTQNSHMENYCHTAQRKGTRSPINFREGRRASDGLVCQDVIAFRQKLKDGMKAGGMLELRQEHNQLLESYSGEIDTSNSSIPHLEPVIKPPLGKRMSLPTNSIDLPPHRLLEIKKSIQLDHHLAGSQEVHDITHPFGPLRPYEPVQIHPFNSQPQPSLQRQVHNRAISKYKYKQQSALHEKFQQMHIEHTNLVPAPQLCAGMGRGAKHPPLARQPSYKLAQQQNVMPAVFHSSDMMAPLPWEPTAENSNFLLQIANTCTLTNTSSVLSSSTSVSISTMSTQQHLTASSHPFPIHPQYYNHPPPAQ